MYSGHIGRKTREQIQSGEKRNMERKKKRYVFVSVHLEERNELASSYCLVCMASDTVVS